MIVTEKEARSAWDHILTMALADKDEEPFPPTVEKVNGLYRFLARTTHPDAGGSAEDFAKLDRAKHVVQAWLVKQAAAPATAVAATPCKVCGGAGYVVQHTGLPGRKGLRRQCITCHGSGDATYDAHGLHT